jgi:fructose-1,6-bisphosphatase/sedoheptulose 1,7-bisphosphatase-like protein
MRTQESIVGDTAELSVEIEKKLIEDLKTMSENSGLSVDELVNISVKRFRSSHADYMGMDLDYP